MIAESLVALFEKEIIVVKDGSKKDKTSESNSTSVLSFIPYPFSLPLVSYPLVLFLLRNLGEGYCDWPKTGV